VERAGLALEHAAEELRADRGLVLAAVRSDPRALGCAAAALRADRSFVLEAVRLDGLALQFAAEGPRADAAVALAALRQNWRSLRHADLSLRMDRGFVLQAVRVNGLALSLAAGEVRDDPELLLESTKDPTSKLAPSAFAWPAGMALARPAAAPPHAHGAGRRARASGLPLGAFANVAPSAEDLGPQELLAVAMRQLGACSSDGSNCTPGVLDAALDVLQPCPDLPSTPSGGGMRGQLANCGHHLGSLAGPGPGGAGQRWLGGAVGSEPTLSAASAASTACSTACAGVDDCKPGKVPPAAAAAHAGPHVPGRLPNARVSF